jgi:hypothetical protein
VLARLDALAGVKVSRTDSSGRFFWLEPREGVDRGTLEALAVGALGKGTRVLSPEEAAAQLALHGAGDPWLAAREVMTLSFVEGRLLSVRLSGDAAREASLLPGQREAVAEAIRAELFGAMARIHAEGGRTSSGWIYEEWPAIAAAAASRCAGALPAGSAARVAAVLPGLLAR